VDTFDIKGMKKIEICGDMLIVLTKQNIMSIDVGGQVYTQSLPSSSSPSSSSSSSSSSLITPNDMCFRDGEIVVAGGLIFFF
jgi:hypothetical protein